MLLYARKTVLKNHMPRGVVGVFSLSLIQRLSVYHLALVASAVTRRYGQAVNALSEGSDWSTTWSLCLRWRFSYRVARAEFGQEAYRSCTPW